MIKKSIYPKTKRLKLKNEVTITEKMDGSNLVIFKKDSNIFIAQRSNIINVHTELEDSKKNVV